MPTYMTPLYTPWITSHFVSEECEWLWRRQIAVRWKHKHQITSTTLVSWFLKRYRQHDEETNLCFDNHYHWSLLCFLETCHRQPGQGRSLKIVNWPSINRHEDEDKFIAGDGRKPCFEDSQSKDFWDHGVPSELGRGWSGQKLRTRLCRQLQPWWKDQNRRDNQDDQKTSPAWKQIVNSS